MASHIQRRLPDGLANPEKDRRPDCMIALGLAPPYTLEDVKAAYYQKAHAVHPDHGGSAQDFHRLHVAFEQAQDLVEYQGDRRRWIAGKLHDYLSMRQAIERFKQLGACTTSVSAEWLKDTVGEFAQLTEVVISVRLVDSSRGDHLIKTLLEERPALKNLIKIEMPGCRVTDRAVVRLSAYKWLRHLDLSRTPITSKALTVLDSLPNLQSLNLDGTQIGWWTRRRVKKQVRELGVGSYQAFGKLPNLDQR